MNPSSPKKLQWTKAKSSSSSSLQVPELTTEEWTRHVYYAAACVISKTLFRSLLRVVASKGLSLVNFWYPFLATIACVHHERHPTTTQDDSDQKKQSSSHSYWFQYWTLYALAQALDHFLLQVCMVLFRHSSSLALRNQWMAELNLLFTIYLLVMPSGASFCYRLVQPHVRKVHYQISEAVSMDTWNTLISSKIEKFLELMVNIHIMEAYWKELIIGILKESRTLIVPAAVTLLPLTPALFTRLGVMYSQFLLPVGKTCTVTKKSPILHSLQYWILHSFVSIVFEAFRYFWWIPFYDHSMFLFWAYLSFDSTVKQYYTILELDLISLGLLPGDENIKVGVHETQTVQLLTAIAKKIPSADRAELEKLIEQGTSNKGQHPAVLTSRAVQQQGGGLQWSQERSQKRVVEREPKDVTDQLKSLIRQLPIEAQEDLDDEKTKQLLEMLMQQLKKEEEKVVSEIQDETLSPPPSSNVRLVAHSSKRQINHPPSSSFSSSGDSEIFYDSKTNQSRRTVVMREREESFQTAQETEIRMSSTRESMASMDTISTTDSNAGKFSMDEEEEEEEEAMQHRTLAPEEDETETRVSTLDAVVVDMKSAQESATSPGRLAMTERRLKRERVKNPKPQNSGSLVTRFVEALETKHKARRKDKREKMKEKRKEKLIKSS